MQDIIAALGLLTGLTGITYGWTKAAAYKTKVQIPSLRNNPHAKAMALPHWSYWNKRAYITKGRGV